MKAKKFLKSIAAPATPIFAVFEDKDEVSGLYLQPCPIVAHYVENPDDLDYVIPLCLDSETGLEDPTVCRNFLFFANSKKEAHERKALSQRDV